MGNDTRELLVTGGRLVLSDRVEERGCVRTRGSRILFAGPCARDPGSALAVGDVQVIDAGGGFICPALVEMHIHGCGPVSFHDPAPGNRIEESARILARGGVGVFVPTVYADPSLISALAEEIGDGHPRVGGIYVEGPFVSDVRRGAIPPAWVEAPSPEALNEVVAPARGHLRLMSVAPECVEGHREWLLAELQAHGVICCIGHSNASAGDLRAWEDVTPLNVTHLFNGMSGVSHREPGVAAWALTQEKLYTEINGDGVHVHPTVLRLILRARPPGRCILISDAVVGSGEDQPEAVYSGVRIKRRGRGMYYTHDDVLVGSACTILEVVAGVLRGTELGVHEVVGMASRVPLELLGYSGKGALAPGMDADIAVFDGSFESCHALIYGGRVNHLSRG